MFSYCLLCFKKGFAESRASNERHRVTFPGGGLTFWSVCLPVVHSLSVAVVVVFNVCFVLISFKFKTLSDLFVEDSRGVVVPFDAFSPLEFFVSFCLRLSCVCECVLCMFVFVWTLLFECYGVAPYTCFLSLYMYLLFVCLLVLLYLCVCVLLIFWTLTFCNISWLTSLSCFC